MNAIKQPPSPIASSMSPDADPIAKECVGKIVASLTAKIDNECRSVLDAFKPGWTLNQIREHCKLVRFYGSPIETLYWDSTPLLELHPIETSIEQKNNGYVYRVTRNTRRLYYQSSSIHQPQIADTPGLER